MIRKIIPAADPKLRKKSKSVKKIDKKVLLLIKDLKETLADQTDPEGVAIAAPQIGKNLRVFVTSYKELKTFINPQILSTTKSKSKTQKQKIMEGCLSIPHFYGPLVRPQEIVLKYISENAKEKKEKFKGFLAQIIQHEIDHLNGILFTDKLLKEKKPLFKLDENDEWEEVELI